MSIVEFDGVALAALGLPLLVGPPCQADGAELEHSTNDAIRSLHEAIERVNQISFSPIQQSALILLWLADSTEFAHSIKSGADTDFDPISLHSLGKRETAWG